MFGILILLGKGIPGLSIRAKPSTTLIGTFIFGIVFALSWSGCIGPVLGFALTMAANTQTAFGGGLLLLVYTLGLLTPLILVSIFIDKLPRNGKIWKIMQGKLITIGTWQVQSTQLITAVMFIVLGIMLLLGVDVLLSSSPIISKIFDIEDWILNSVL